MDLKKVTWRQWLEILIWCLAGFFFCKELAQFEQRFKRILVVAIICTISIIIHLRRTLADPDYEKEVWGLRQKTGRDCRYDWLRVLAVVMVIMTHAIQVDLHENMVSGRRAEFIFIVIYMLCLACNLIYVMLSGALLIPYRDESIWKFYTKRISAVALPMGIYYFFYLWQAGELAGGGILYVMQNFLLRLCQGNTPEAPHYWLMYVLLSIYIVIPFFRYMFWNMPYKVLTGAVILGLFLMGVDLFCPFTLGISSFLGKWEGIAIIGYWVTRPETRKYYCWLMRFGIFAFCVMAGMIWQNVDYRTLCGNHSPVMALICMGLFAAVLKYGDIFNKGNTLLRVLSKYSYSLILVHWWALHWIVRGKLDIHIGQYGGMGLIPETFITLAVSLLISFLIDNLVVMPVQMLFDWICRKSEMLINNWK